MRRFRASYLAALVGLLATLPVAGQAASKDRKVFPGVECGVLSHLADGSTYHYIKGFYNAGSSLAVAYCPVPRDNTRNEDGVRRVLVHLTTPSGELASCTLRSLTQYGVVLETVSGILGGGTGSIDLDLYRSAPDGFYVLYCNLPTKSYLHSYEIQEYGSTDKNR